MPDYRSNIKTIDDPARIKKQLALSNVFGYCPIYGPSMSDLTTAERILNHIISAYPGYQWVVEVRGEVVTVVNETLSANMGFRMLEKQLDNDGKKVMWAAGELLERYNLRRGPMNPEMVRGLPSNGREKLRVGE